VFRYPDLKDDVEMRKIKDHYIFTVESVGAVEPEELVKV
jgi:DNA-directed RNA polymerase I and III subunit RPAC1